ncbi:quinone-dependent dihydroorotate dehydrogenase [Merismopedia glauca]|uniref:Dihydroorotate dehydrogenase (quinone) n=1 Tax=Merismopedia glauca CCAP 1448/3 TaxID=1296344 RepID=A0A2T1C4Y7_9CYAN|nr:quinone-dependent dihydroorotate dehydrogenase [Merismopedia glauca]PSB03340.1 dihydroorotate dehydrogenase (quinone) [Merismopedia glauca CCAP 1448/3]
MDIYRHVIRPLLFSANVDPERSHQQTLQILVWLEKQRYNPVGKWTRKQLERSLCYSNLRLSQTLWGIDFANPLGLAAGFDKDGLAAPIWSSFGFGFAELGTVTFHPQLGNPPPRLFRLTQDLAALNRMGFNNQGAAALAERLSGYHLRDNLLSSGFPLGINLGKSKITPLEEAAGDYVASFRLLQDYGDYFVINVSSPNTPGLRSLQSQDQLSLIIEALLAENQHKKPILVKIAPDLEWSAISKVVELAQSYKLAGIIATNTTISREGLQTKIVKATGKPITEEAGGISGAPLRDRSTAVIRYIWQQSQGKIPIIGVGGVFTADDAWEKITAGASLIQVYTGWIYSGPAMVKEILGGLLQKLDDAGLASISDAVGKAENKVSGSPM